MKKVKIMLTALTVFAVVGGALAFKAKKMNAQIFCTTGSGANVTCPTPRANWTVVDPQNGAATLSLTCTDVQNAKCAKTTIYELQ